MIRELNTAWHSLPSNLGFAQDSAAGAKRLLDKLFFRACLVEILRKGGLIGQLGYFRRYEAALGLQDSVKRKPYALVVRLGVPKLVKVTLHLD